MPGLLLSNQNNTVRGWSRRRLLQRAAALAVTGAASAALAGCGHLPDAVGFARGLAGSAQVATGSSSPPLELNWVTPILPSGAIDSSKADVATRDRARGWQQMLAPWQGLHPSITIVSRVVPESDLSMAETALAHSGGPADVAYTDWGAALGDAKVVDPLDLGELSRAIVPVAFAPHTSGNQVYALPVFLTGLGLYLGHARFTEAELDPTAPLHSWSSFETTAQKLTDRSHQRCSFDVFGRGSPMSGEMRYAPFLWSAGGAFFDDAGAKATWNAPPGLEAIVYLARLSQNYASAGSATASDQSLAENWLAGRTAMILAGPEFVPLADAQKLTYSVQSIPAYIQGQASSLAMSAGASALFAISKHKDWALDLVRYLAGKDAQVAGLSSVPLLPANTGAGDDAPVFRGNPPLAQFLRILREDDVHSFPLARSSNLEVQEIFRAYLGVALQGLTTPELAWNRSAAAASPLLPRRWHTSCRSNRAHQPEDAMERFSLTLFDYARDHQWPRMLGWSDDELNSVPIHYEATSGGNYLNLANFGATGLGVSAESGGGTSAGVHSIQNVYVYQNDTPPQFYQRLQQLMDQGGPNPYPPPAGQPVQRRAGQS